MLPLTDTDTDTLFKLSTLPESVETTSVLAFALATAASSMAYTISDQDALGIIGSVLKMITTPLS